MSTPIIQTVSNSGPGAAPVYQCEECLRYFQLPVFGDGRSEMGDRFVLMAPQPVGGLGIPESCACGLPECGALKARLLAEQQAIDRRGQARVQEFWQRKRAARLLRQEECRGKKAGARVRARGKVAALGGAAALLAPGDAADGHGEQCYSSCPPEREFPVGSGVRVIESLPHAEQVQAFAGSGNAKAQNERMLALLKVGFDEARPEVPGPWVTNGVLQAAGIGRPASRASDLRGTDQREPHAFVKYYGLDVDCSPIENTSGNGKEHYAYRLCLKGVSTRLLREQRRDERQGVLPTVEAHQ